MDLWKFLDLIDTKELYLHRVDLFEDKYEGRYPGNDPVSNILSEFDENLKKNRFITCFSEYSTENFTMWKIYTNPTYGIAIKSNIKNLISSLENDPEDTLIGKVEYTNSEGPLEINFKNEQVLINYFTKRIYFDYEKEIRILSGLIENPKEIKGLRLKVNLKDLIKEIYISPFASDNFKDLIELKLKQINLEVSINKSHI